MQSPAEFLAALHDASVLGPEIERNIAAWAKAMNADTPAIAKYIHEQNWLTTYQIQRIHAGKGKKLTVGPYILLDILGEGSMGRVFRAKHSRMGREVALKVIRKERLGNPRVVLRFQQEVRAVGQLAHPNIVLAIDADTIGEQHFVAMELIDGKDLKKLVQDHGPMPMHVACEYVRQAALGLQHAFEQKLVHRDVKPSNLMVTKQGVVKVLDFGLASLNTPEAMTAEERATLDGKIVGTPDYMAPEQADNSAAADTRADIYALGGTLFYLLSAKTPFEAPTSVAKIHRHKNDPPPNLLAHRPDLPPQLQGLIHWLLAKDPALRPQAPLQVAAALQPFCMPLRSTHIPPLAIPPETTSQVFQLPASDSPARVRQRGHRGSPWLFAIIAFAVLAIALGLAWYVIKKMQI